MGVRARAMRVVVVSVTFAIAAVASPAAAQRPDAAHAAEVEAAAAGATLEAGSSKAEPKTPRAAEKNELERPAAGSPIQPTPGSGTASAGVSRDLFGGASDTNLLAEAAR